MEKGFVPEQGLGDVFTDVVSVGKGAHKNSSPFETIFLGNSEHLRQYLIASKKRKFLK